MTHIPCPNDAMQLPQVAEVATDAGPMRFFWCWSCEELFAFAGTPAVLVAGFAEGGQGGWRVFRAVGGKSAVQAAVVAAAYVSPGQLLREP